MPCFFASQGFQVDAYDLSREGIARVNHLASQHGLLVHTQVGDMLKLPYEDASMDCMMAYHVIYHTDKAGIEQVFAEIQRVLAPGGEIYLTLNSRRNPTFRDPSNQVIDAHTIRKTHGAEAGVPHYYVDLREASRLLKGFEQISLNHIGHLRDGRFSWHYHILARKPA